MKKKNQIALSYAIVGTAMLSVAPNTFYVLCALALLTYAIYKVVS